MPTIKTYGLILLLLFSGAHAADATSWDEAFKLKREAIDVIRNQIGRPFKAGALDPAIKNLDDAEQVLKTTPSDDPDADEAMLDDVAILKAWATNYVAHPPPEDKKATVGQTSALNDAASLKAKDLLIKGDALRHDARQLRRDGNFEDAAAKYKEFVAVMDQLTGAANPEAMLALDRLSHYFVDESAFKLAEVYFKRVLDDTEKRLPPTDLFVLRDVLDYASIQNSLGNSKLAEPLFKRVIAGCEHALGHDDKSLIRAYQGLNYIYSNQRHWDSVEQNLKNLAAIREKCYPKDDPRLLNTKLETADMYFSQGNSLKAAELYKQVLEEREKAYGAGDDRLFGNLRMLAVCYVVEAKNLDEAEQLYNRALAMAEKKGPNTPNVALVQFNRANLYARQNRPADAEKAIRQSLEIREKCYGLFGTDVGWTCNALGNILRAQGHKDLAEAQYTRALTILEKQFGSDSQNLGSPLLNLGNIYADQEQFAKAEQYYLRVLALLEKVSGETSTDVPRVCNNLALLYSKQKKWSQAIPMHTRAVQLAEKVVGPDSLDLAQYLSNYSQTLRKMSNNVEADKTADRAKAIRAKAAKEEKGDK